MKNREQFLMERTVVGASEVGAVMGLSPYADSADVYDRLVLLLDHGKVLDDEPTGPMQRGTLLEGVAARMFVQLTGKRIRRHGADVCPLTPWLRANPDREILADENGDGTGLLEIKWPGQFMFDKIKLEGLPDYWTTQVQAQLACRPRLSWADIYICSADPWDQMLLRIERNDPFIDTVLVPAVDFFWTEYVEPRQRPEVVLTPDAVLPPDPAAGELVIIDTPEFVDAVSKLDYARQVKAKATKADRLWAAKVKEIVGDNTVIDGGGFRVYYRPEKPRFGWDAKKLAHHFAAQDLDPADFKKQQAPRRPLKLYPAPIPVQPDVPVEALESGE